MAVLISPMTAPLLMAVLLSSRFFWFSWWLLFLVSGLEVLLRVWDFYGRFKAGLQFCLGFVSIGIYFWIFNVLVVGFGRLLWFHFRTDSFWGVFWRCLVLPDSCFGTLHFGHFVEGLLGVLCEFVSSSSILGCLTSWSFHISVIQFHDFFFSKGV